MAATGTPLFRIQDVLGDDLLGDAPAASAKQVLADAEDILDEAGDSAEDAASVPAQSGYAWITPLNNAGAQALARLTLDGSTLHVDIRGSGFTPGEAHAVTLSGRDGGVISGIPTVALDANGDGRLDAEEVSGATGPVLFTLGEAVAGDNGRIAVSTSLTVEGDALEALQDRLDGRQLGIAGVDGEADLPAAGGRLVDLGGQLGLALDLLDSISPGFTGDIFARLLEAQEPYTLAPDGSGPIAGERPGAADTDATHFVSLIQPTNNSGVVGAAVITFDEAAGEVTVDLDLGGLTPGREHPMHVHGLVDGSPSLLANFTLDADDDGFLESNEVAGTVGPVLFGLTADGSISDATLTGDFPVADAEGRVSLEQTYSFDLGDDGEAALFERLQDRMTGRMIEVHGLETAAQGAGTPGEVDGDAGYQPGLPVASGVLLPLEGVDGVLTAGVGYVVQSTLDGEDPTLLGLLSAVQPGLGSLLGGDSLFG